MSRRSDPSQLQTALRGVRLLEMFLQEQRDLTLAEVCLRLGVPKSTGARFLNTFVGAGYLERVDVGRYRLGPSMERLSPPRAAESRLRHVATPYLRELVEAHGESAHLGVRQDQVMVTIRFLEGTHTIRMASHEGARRPIHCSSMGKALLAFSEPWVVDLVLSEPLEPLTPRTITDAAALRRELHAIRKRGYAVDDEEVEGGLRCVGAPVFDDGGRAVAGISVSGPTSRLTLDSVEQVGTLIRDTGLRISAELGWHPENTESSVRSTLYEASHSVG